MFFEYGLCVGIILDVGVVLENKGGKVFCFLVLECWSVRSLGFFLFLRYLFCMIFKKGNRIEVERVNYV